MFDCVLSNWKNIFILKFSPLILRPKWRIQTCIIFKVGHETLLKYYTGSPIIYAASDTVFYRNWRELEFFPSLLFFFFSVTDSRANSRVTQWSRRWRTCVIGRNSFHAIYMPRKLRVCAAYICISLDPLFRWQRLSSRRWAVVPISDDSELATTLSRSNIGHRCKTLRLATCLRAVQDHSTHYPRGRRHVPLRDHVFVEFKIFPYIVKNYKSKYPWINFVEKCSVRWRGKIFYFIISIQLSRPFIPSILISLLTS